MRNFLCEADFATRMQQEVLPTITACRTDKTVTGADGTALYTCHYRAACPRGTVVLVHGFSETAEKYHEFIYYLLCEGLSVLIYDHRGHGRSGRTAPVGVIHVKRFDDYVSDLACVLTAYGESLAAPLYLFAHSMGGGVATIFMEKYPNVFQKAVLSAPMIDLLYRGVTRLACRAACRFCMLTGRAQKAVFISKKDYANEPFESSSSLSPARFAYLREGRRTASHMSGGAPSYAWSAAALSVRKRALRKNAPEGVPSPVLLLSATRDHLVCSEAQAALVARLPHATLTKVNSKHEILFANDEVLHPVLHQILDFYA